jgi:hypothetical protein
MDPDLTRVMTSMTPPGNAITRALLLLAVVLPLACGDPEASAVADTSELLTSENRSGAAANSLMHSVNNSQVLPDQGLSFWATLPSSFISMASDADSNASSLLILFEDDLPLGPANATHTQIRDVGRGAYSHWQSGLYFSSSDGSDPRTNGRSYRIADLKGGWTSVRIPPGALRWSFDPQMITSELGLAWRIKALPEWAGLSSNADQPRRSRMVLLENGLPLPLPNAVHGLIREAGGGAYSHWGNVVLFSASDNSDPRSNGYIYEAALADGLYGRAYPEPEKPVIVQVVELRETLATPEWVVPARAGDLLGLTPTFEARHALDDVLFYFEIDTSEAFDSRNLLRWPRVSEDPGHADDATDPNPLVVLDPDSDGASLFRPPFRLSAMALQSDAENNAVVRQAHRLIHGLPVGFTQVHEVVRYAAQQIDPTRSTHGSLAATDVLAAGRGNSSSINALIQTMLDNVGYDTRLVSAQVPRLVALEGSNGLGTHTGLEVWWDDAWRYVDGYFDVLSWGGDLASYSGTSETLDAVFVYPSSGVLAQRDESFRRVTLADYAEHVRYQHDAYAARVEAADYVDPRPHGSPDQSLDRRAIWPDDVLTLYARVRVVRADASQLRHVFPGREPEQGLGSSQVEVSPWVVRTFRVDLSQLPNR